MLFDEKRFVYLFNVFPASIKSINAIQIYPHTVESYACILKLFVLMFSSLSEYVLLQNYRNK